MTRRAALRRATTPYRQRGAALLLIMLIAMTIGLALLFGRSEGQSARYTRSSGTESALVQAREGLLAYAVTYRDTHPNQVFGYLPCPDVTGDGQSDTAAAGTPGCTGGSGSAAVGLLPYKSLGLPLLRDREGNCLWYAVSRSFKADLNKMEPMNWDTQGQFRVRDPSGNVMIAPDDAEGGAAAVVFAPGAPLTGQAARVGDFTNAAKPCGIPAVNSALVAQYLDGNPTPASPPGPTTPYAFATTGAIDLTLGPVILASSQIVNDRAVWLTPRQIFTRLQQRPDFATLHTTGITALRNQLNNATALSDNPPGVGDTLPAGNNLLASAAFADPSSELNYYRNWRDHFRYRRCAPAGSYCFTVNGIQCDGVLLFGGAASVAAGNGTELPRPTGSGIDAYFEGDNRTSLNGTGTIFNGNSTPYDAGTPAQDMAFCLVQNPSGGPTLSFASDFGTLSTVTDTSIGDVDGDGTADSTVTLNATTRTLTLGDRDLEDSVVSAARLFGCAWFGNSITVGSRTSVYFAYEVDRAGQGFTFALADKASNPTTNMCGRSSGGLGYSGVTSGVTPILGPKIGVEIDLTPNNVVNPRNDPPNPHLAVVFEGVPSDVDDDNVHGSLPNPAPASSGVKEESGFALAARRHVRIEIIKVAGGSNNTFAVLSWVLRDVPLPTGFSDTTTGSPFSLPAGFPAADVLSVTAATILPNTQLQEAWVGFTNSTRTDEQVIQIQNFEITAHP